MAFVDFFCVVYFEFIMPKCLIPSFVSQFLSQKTHTHTRKKKQIKNKNTGYVITLKMKLITGNEKIDPACTQKTDLTGMTRVRGQF